MLSKVPKPEFPYRVRFERDRVRYLYSFESFSHALACFGHLNSGGVSVVFEVVEVSGCVVRKESAGCI